MSVYYVHLNELFDKLNKFLTGGIAQSGPAWVICDFLEFPSVIKLKWTAKAYYEFVKQYIKKKRMRVEMERFKKLRNAYFLNHLYRHYYKVGMEPKLTIRVECPRVDWTKTLLGIQIQSKNYSEEDKEFSQVSIKTHSLTLDEKKCIILISYSGRPSPFFNNVKKSLGMAYDRMRTFTWKMGTNYLRSRLKFRHENIKDYHNKIKLIGDEWGRSHENGDVVYQSISSLNEEKEDVERRRNHYTYYNIEEVLFSVENEVDKKRYGGGHVIKTSEDVEYDNTKRHSSEGDEALGEGGIEDEETKKLTNALRDQLSVGGYSTTKSGLGRVRDLKRTFKIFVDAKVNSKVKMIEKELSETKNELREALLKICEFDKNQKMIMIMMNEMKSNRNNDPKEKEEIIKKKDEEQKNKMKKED